MVIGTLSEAASKQLLAAKGIPVLPERTAASPATAELAAREIGFPVVLKLCGPHIAHKTERGLVRLRVPDGPGARAAAEELLGLARPEDGDVEVLVAPMVQGTRELLAGVSRDPQFGPCVLLGFGGVLAEAVADVSVRLAPLTELDAEDMIDDLGSQALLGPLRGEPAVDREALRAILLGLSELATDPEINSIDLNPLIVVEGRPVVVDALVELRSSA